MALVPILCGRWRCYRSSTDCAIPTAFRPLGKRRALIVIGPCAIPANSKYCDADVLMCTARCESSACGLFYDWTHVERLRGIILHASPRISKRRLGRYDKVMLRDSLIAVLCYFTLCNDDTNSDQESI